MGSRAHKCWSRSFLFKDFLVPRPHYSPLPSVTGHVVQGLTKRDWKNAPQGKLSFSSQNLKLSNKGLTPNDDDDRTT